MSKLHMISTGNTKHSQFALQCFKKIWGNIKPKTRKEIKRNRRSDSRIFNQAWFSTISDETANTSPNLVRMTQTRTDNTKGLVNNLNCLRCNFHKDFLSLPNQGKLVPKCFELTLGPKTGNYDQKPTDKWYSNHKEFSLTQMKSMVSYCQKDE